MIHKKNLKERKKGYPTGEWRSSPRKKSEWAVPGTMFRDAHTRARAGPSRAEPSRAEPSRAEPSRAEPSRVRFAHCKSLNLLQLQKPTERVVLVSHPLGGTFAGFCTIAPLRLFAEEGQKEPATAGTTDVRTSGLWTPRQVSGPQVSGPASQAGTTDDRRRTAGRDARPGRRASGHHGTAFSRSKVKS